MSSVRLRLPEALHDSVRSTLKELAWLTVRYRPGAKRTIGLFCTRRGGSTWLMEIIAANRGVLPLNQPFDLLTPNMTPYHFKRLPKFDRGQIVHPTPEEEAELRAYADDVMSGRIRVAAPHAFWKRDFSFRADRLLLKTLGTKAMMDWFDATYGVDVVYLVRHPVPQALSCLRNGWATTSMAYLRNEWFRSEVIGDPALAAYAENVHRNGEPLERFVLNWVLENLYPLQVVADRPHWLALSYEECVVDRARVFDVLRERLQLTDLERMRRAAARASRSSSLASPDAMSAIKSGNLEAQVSGWQDRVPAQERLGATRVLDRFGVTLYSGNAALPDWAGYRAEATPSAG